ncbi:hypothetical protein [Scytonema sp. PCC 10023]
MQKTDTDTDSLSTIKNAASPSYLGTGSNAVKTNNVSIHAV